MHITLESYWSCTIWADGLTLLHFDRVTILDGKNLPLTWIWDVLTKVLSNTIETNFQILSTKYAKFQPNIQIFEYSISCLVTYINNYFDTYKPK